MEQGTRKPSLGERWTNFRPTKTLVFWSLVTAVIVTMSVGFTWGGWVTGGTARKMAEVQRENAVVSRLAPICAVQVSLDPKRDQKLQELKEISAWEQGDYVKKQGWATMPGEKEPESSVANACARLIIQ